MTATRRIDGYLTRLAQAVWPTAVVWVDAATYEYSLDRQGEPSVGLGSGSGLIALRALVAAETARREGYVTLTIPLGVADRRALTRAWAHRWEGDPTEADLVTAIEQEVDVAIRDAVARGDAGLEADRLAARGDIEIGRGNV